MASSLHQMYRRHSASVRHLAVGCESHAREPASKTRGISSVLMRLRVDSQYIVDCRRNPKCKQLYKITAAREENVVHFRPVNPTRPSDQFAGQQLWYRRRVQKGTCNTSGRYPGDAAVLDGRHRFYFWFCSVCQCKPVTMSSNPTPVALFRNMPLNFAGLQRAETV